MKRFDLVVTVGVMSVDAADADAAKKLVTEWVYQAGFSLSDMAFPVVHSVSCTETEVS